MLPLYRCVVFLELFPRTVAGGFSSSSVAHLTLYFFFFFSSFRAFTHSLPSLPFALIIRRRWKNVNNYFGKLQSVEVLLYLYNIYLLSLLLVEETN